MYPAALHDLGHFVLDLAAVERASASCTAELNGGKRSTRLITRRGVCAPMYKKARPIQRQLECVATTSLCKGKAQLTSMSSSESCCAMHRRTVFLLLSCSSPASRSSSSIQ
jgi:hypothetical protein